jgi:hypothetical protein
MALGRREKGKEYDRVNNIKMHYICPSRGHNGMYWKGQRKKVGESNREIWTYESKVYLQLSYIENTGFEINNERQDYKIGTVRGCIWGEEGE